METITERLKVKIAREKEKILSLRNNIALLRLARAQLGPLHKLQAVGIRISLHEKPPLILVDFFRLTPESCKALLDIHCHRSRTAAEQARTNTQGVTMAVIDCDTGNRLSESSTGAYLYIYAATGQGSPKKVSDIMRINLTRHYAHPDQGCAPRTVHQAQEIRKLLAFETEPDLTELITRSHQLAAVAKKAGATEAMIDGPLYLAHILDRILRELYEIQPVYIFKETTIEL